MEEKKILTTLEEHIPLPDDSDSFDDDQMGLLWDALHKAAAEIAKLVEEEFTEATTTALDSYIIQLDAKEAQLAEMREALRSIEWGSYRDGQYFCPWCGYGKSHGHDPRGCVFEKALSAAPEAQDDEKPKP